MANFFNSQIDYIFFFYGLSFLLLAQACLSAGKAGRKALPWRWLGLFGLAHGSHEILELFAASVGDSEAFAVVRLAVLTASFLSLLEFGRAGSAEYGGYEAKRWLLLPFIAAASLGANAGLAGMVASVRYSLGFTGGLWAAYALFAASRDDRSGGVWLKAAAAVMAAYAVFTGLIVPPAPFLPASLVNTQSFMAQTRMPVQVVRAAAALLFSVFTIAYTHRPCADEDMEKLNPAIPGCSFRPILMVLAITAAGWLVTEAVGDYGEGLARTYAMDAAAVTRQVSVFRLFSIIITMILSGFSLAFYAAWQGSRESAERGAALRIASQRLEDEKRLRALAYALSEGVVMEEGGKVAFANPEAVRLLGWTEEDLKGEALCDVAHCRDSEHRKVRPEEFPTARSAVSGAVCRMDDLYFTRRDGTTFPVSCVCSPIKDGGSHVGTVITFQDITARKDLDKQKADFYAMVTHDLKSPLSIIQGYTDILLIDWRHKFDFETITVLNSIWDSCGKLLRLVNDFLTVSRFEFGRLPLNESLESVSQILAEIKEEFQGTAQKKNIGLDIRTPDGLPRIVFDKTHVHRAIQNLVENALAYSPAGGKVVVQAETATVDGTEFIRVSVTDEGPAIPEGEAEKVFDMYYSSPRTAGIKGSGLGLAIAKGVAAAHGGRVDLISSEGRGSTFEFLLPVKKS